jgi:puromycin-sensitive aminopeptidase
LRGPPPTRRTFLTGATVAALGLAAPACGPVFPLLRWAGPPISPDDPYRLPRSVVPRRYDLRIEPDLAAGRFAGEATIEVVVDERVDEVVLNAAELEIHEARVSGGRGQALLGTVTLDPPTERARIRFPAALEPGTWRLDLRFSGVLRDGLTGFYRSRFTIPGRGPAGAAASMLAVTQFQAADARRAFPCWDEPAFKAVFAITLVVDRHLIPLSNGAVVSEGPAPRRDKKIVRFAPTIPMPTYVVAFVVGDLEASEAVRVDGVPVRVWWARGRSQPGLARFALETATFALRFLRTYYGLPYPGEKLDLIAVPDFEAGAMENHGAIIFRETNLLIDEPRATSEELRLVADTVAHEIAHMWFGNLVTMAWWNGLWLNEAFARFMEIMTVDAWRPAWDRWAQFGAGRAAALEIDGLDSTRPVEFEVRAPADAEAMFDVLTYQKGAATLRMLERHLGPEAFQAGVGTYLRRHRFGNAETRDLWAAIGEASGQPVAAMMEAWVARPGYPLVSVRREVGGRALTFSQRRFTYGSGTGDSTIWTIPVHFRVGLAEGTRSMRVLLASPEVRVDLPAPARFVVVNEGAVGFYRTHYARDLLAELAAEPFARLAPLERCGLVDDAWAHALAGLIPAAEYLDLTAAFRSEPDRNVWAALIGSFTELVHVVPPSEARGFAALIRDRVGPTATRLGWSPAPGESTAVQQLRADVQRALGILGDDGAVHAAVREIYARYRTDPSAVHPSMVGTVLAVHAHAGTAVDYADFLERRWTAVTPTERLRYLLALARFRAPELIERTLGLAMSGEVRKQDVPFLLRSLLLSAAGRERAWRFLMKEWDTLERALGQRGLDTVCEGIPALASPALEAEVRSFFAGRRVTLGGRKLDQHLEQLRIAVAFGEREAANLAAYLSR